MEMVFHQYGPEYGLQVCILPENNKYFGELGKNAINPSQKHISHCPYLSIYLRIRKQATKDVALSTLMCYASSGYVLTTTTRMKRLCVAWDDVFERRTFNKFWEMHPKNFKKHFW